MTNFRHVLYNVFVHKCLNICRSNTTNIDQNYLNWENVWKIDDNEIKNNVNVWACMLWMLISAKAHVDTIFFIVSETSTKKNMSKKFIIFDANEVEMNKNDVFREIRFLWAIEKFAEIFKIQQFFFWKRSVMRCKSFNDWMIHNFIR